MLPIIVGGLALLTAAAWNKARKAKQNSTYGVLTADRKYILVRALDGKLTPAQYNQFADTFASQGLPDEAGILRRRASLGAMSPEQKAKLNDLVQQALASNKPEGIQGVADYMLSIGAVGNASKLAAHAKATASAAAIKPNAPEVIPAPVVEAAPHDTTPPPAEPVTQT